MDEQGQQIAGTRTFDHIRGSVWGTPGFKRKSSTITETLPLVGATQTTIVETVRNDEQWTAFIQVMGPDGAFRMVLPEKAVLALVRQYEALMKLSKRERAQKAAHTRRLRCPRHEADQGDDEDDSQIKLLAGGVSE